MTWIIIAICVVIYLAIGFIIARAFAQTDGRRFLDALKFVGTMLLWPVAIVVMLAAFMAWAASGSH